MRLTDEQIESFRTAYKAGYSEEVSFEEAREMATRLVSFYLTVEKLMRKRDTKKAAD
jgi:hypothetical protein